MPSSPKSPVVVLQPGEYYFADRAEEVSVHTLLGSCIAITLWHPARRIGGMCHYLLPLSRSNPSRLTRGHYADGVMAIFADAVADAGTRPGDYEVNMIGGGNMFAASRGPDAAISVPQANIEAGRRLLSNYGFRIKSADVGGACYRRVHFELATGELRVKRGAATAGAATQP